MIRKLLKHSIIVGILIAIDQVAKLLVRQYVIADDQFRNGIHLHPSLHTKFEAEELPIVIISGVIISTLIVLLACKGNEFFFHDRPERMKKSYPLFTNIMLYLLLAGNICSVIIDALFWGGSLNFICIAWQAVESGHNHANLQHFIFDIKDIYLTMGMVMFLIRIIMFAVRISKEDEKHMMKKLCHPIKSVNAMKATHR